MDGLFEDQREDFALVTWEMDLAPLSTSKLVPGHFKNWVMFNLTKGAIGRLSGTSNQRLSGGFMRSESADAAGNHRLSGTSNQRLSGGFMRSESADAAGNQRFRSESADAAGNLKLIQSDGLDAFGNQKLLSGNLMLSGGLDALKCGENLAMDTSHRTIHGSQSWHHPSSNENCTETVRQDDPSEALMIGIPGAAPLMAA
eukprot:Skav208077  [mRNA]  locus=scaffold1800:69892:73052:- [translate_table: standard]